MVAETAGCQACTPDEATTQVFEGLVQRGYRGATTGSPNGEEGDDGDAAALLEVVGELRATALANMKAKSIRADDICIVVVTFEPFWAQQRRGGK